MFSREIYCPEEWTESLHGDLFLFSNLNSLSMCSTDVLRKIELLRSLTRGTIVKIKYALMPSIRLTLAPLYFNFVLAFLLPRDAHRRSSARNGNRVYKRRNVSFREGREWENSVRQERCSYNLSAMYTHVRCLTKSRKNIALGEIPLILSSWQIIC